MRFNLVIIRNVRWFVVTALKPTANRVRQFVLQSYAQALR